MATTHPSMCSISVLLWSEDGIQKAMNYRKSDFTTLGVMIDDVHMKWSKYKGTEIRSYEDILGRFKCNRYGALLIDRDGKIIDEDIYKCNNIELSCDNCHDHSLYNTWTDSTSFVVYFVEYHKNMKRKRAESPILHFGDDEDNSCGIETHLTPQPERTLLDWADHRVRKPHEYNKMLFVASDQTEGPPHVICESSVNIIDKKFCFIRTL